MIDYDKLKVAHALIGEILAAKPEYCEHSGVKLGMREKKCSEGGEHVNNISEGQMIGTQWALKCKKCGEFYR